MANGTVGNSTAQGNAQIGVAVTNYLINKQIISSATTFGGGVADAVAVGPAWAGSKPDSTAFPAVNTFSLAGSVMPGKWTLRRAEKKFGWQIQQGYWLSGAYLLPKGDQLVVSEFEGEFWAQADYLIYKQIRKKLLSKCVQTLSGIGALLASPKSASSLAMGIDHPELKDLGVDAVVVGVVKATIQEVGGLWRTGIEFIQFRPPIPAPPKPTQKIPDVVLPPPLPLTPLELEIQMNNQILKKLSTQP